VTLEVEKRAAKSGRADSLVIFVHGYGADGHDLIGLADPLAEHLPNTTFLSPHAPNPCKMSPMGREWFPIPMIDNSSMEQMRAGMHTSVARFNEWMDAEFVAEGITPDRTVLVGFSQGTMMSLHVGPRRTHQLAGIVGFSGRLVEPETLIAETVTKPPVLLVHGDMDMVVPPSDMPKAETALVEAGFDVQTHLSRGTAHGIAPDGLGLALQSIQSWL